MDPDNRWYDVFVVPCVLAVWVAICCGLVKCYPIALAVIVVILGVGCSIALSLKEMREIRKNRRGAGL